VDSFGFWKWDPSFPGREICLSLNCIIVSKQPENRSIKNYSLLKRFPNFKIDHYWIIREIKPPAFGKKVPEYI